MYKMFQIISSFDRFFLIYMNDHTNQYMRAKCHLWPYECTEWGKVMLRQQLNAS